MELWRRQIASNDPVGSATAGNDVYEYLEMKVTEVVTTKRRIGVHGEAFCQKMPYLHCLCFSDGASSASQQTPYTGESFGHPQWWHCIVAFADPASIIVSMYCPALAWGGARPWGIHVSRLRRVEPTNVSVEDECILPFRFECLKPSGEKTEALAEPDPEMEPCKGIWV